MEKKKEQIAAEEKAKQMAEEQKKREEERAKKAAEEAEMAKKAELEAEERERQRTIVRKDGVRTEKNSSAVKEKNVSTSSAALKPEQKQADEKQNEVKKSNPIVIRRR